ncbi:DUF4956 domain-containing protein [Arthrobacter sp.]|uniref:DUF4956 domain-containing protein n=1 Tax=Arthrobacter sp. TaxID=1667 RepID=UPI0026DF0206|nr:DUF4956 domain-containing protein [Arthrobacter sp.]MDO5751850.1 DUF4956 domain-containing protein [Arthrobacter sp.]
MLALWVAMAANLICIITLVYAVYFPRYHRRDLALAYVCLNVGIMMVTILLTGSAVGVGLGLGLFGVLSIIRLRSDTLTQGEIGYYFAALVLGLLNGLHPDPAWLAPVLSIVLVATLYVADHPRISPSTRRQTITLDRGYANEAELKQALETLLGAKVMRIEVVALDMVRDLTIADVRYKSASAKAPKQFREMFSRQQQDESNSLIAAPHPGASSAYPSSSAYPAAPANAPTQSPLTAEAPYDYSGTRS